MHNIILHSASRGGAGGVREGGGGRLVDGVGLGGAREERAQHVELRDDAAAGPEVHGRVVARRLQEHLRARRGGFACAHRACMRPCIHAFVQQ